MGRHGSVWAENRANESKRCHPIWHCMPPRFIMFFTSRIISLQDDTPDQFERYPMAEDIIESSENIKELEYEGKEEYEFIESLQANYEEQSTSNHNGGYCFCIKKILGQIWCLLVYGTAGILNILDSALIKIVNRFYYHNI